MLIPSIDLMGGRIVQLVQGKDLKLAFDDFEYWIERFLSYPMVQLIDLDAAMRQGSNRALIEQIAQRLPCQVGGGIGAGVPVSAGFEDFETFSSDAHVAQLDFGAESDDVDDLQGELAGVGVAAVHVICEEGDVEAAEVRY